MTTHKPPRPALALLECLVPDSAFLAGDLAEEYQRRQSRCWLWWEVLGAIAIAWCTRPDAIRPLRLVDLQPADAVERTRRMPAGPPALRRGFSADRCRSPLRAAGA
jgi:hypothetical protein